MIEDRLLKCAAKAPIILDAAIGTRLVALGLDLKTDDPVLWNLKRPALVRELHARDLAAGADAILTNTFGANRVWMARYGLADDVVALNRQAVALARGAEGSSRFVIGSIGPTALTDPTACREQCEILADAGVDALVVETCRLDQARSFLQIVRPRLDLPLIVSLFEWPEPIGPAVRLLEDLGASALGGNCQVGMAPLIAMAQRVRPFTSLPLWVKPSASQPGQSQSPAKPESFAAAVPALLALGVRFLGGCCGSTEAHVAALREVCYPVSND